MNSATGKSSKSTVKLPRKTILVPSSRLVKGTITLAELRQARLFKSRMKKQLKAEVRSEQANSSLIRITVSKPKNDKRNADTPGVSRSRNDSHDQEEYTQVQIIDSEDDPALKDYLMHEIDHDMDSESTEDDSRLVKTEFRREEDNPTLYNQVYCDSADDHDVELCCSGCRNLNLKCLTKLNEILHFLKATKQASENDVINPQLEPEPDFSLLPDFPLQTVGELMNFDAQLADHVIRKQFEQKIAARGGLKMQKSVSSVMAFFMTNEISKRFSWTGVGQTIQVSNMNFVQVIVDIVRRRHPGTIIKEVQDKIAEWLRRCGDRIRATEKAQERKHQTKYPLEHDKLTI